MNVGEQVVAPKLLLGGIWCIRATGLGQAFVKLAHIDGTGNEREIYNHEISVIKLSLDVDADRSGQVEIRDEAGEHNWVWGSKQPGAILMVNCDADVYKPIPANDVQSELVELHIQPTGLKCFPPHYSLNLHSEKNQACRFAVYRKTKRGEFLRVLGKDSKNSKSAKKVSSDLRPEGEILYIEATEFPGPHFEGLLSLELHLNYKGRSLAYDRVAIRVAPWIMVPNTQRPLCVYAVQVRDETGTIRNKGFLRELNKVCKKAGVTLHKIDGARYRDDLWIQDEIEFGYTRTPNHTMPVVFDSPRNRNLDSFPEGELLGPDFGLFRVEGLQKNNLNGFGNLEVSPPVTARGQEYPFGRIVFGGKKYGEYRGNSRQIGAAIRQVLYAQKIQYPIELFSDWLLTGHIDEFLSFSPARDDLGFKVMLASPAKAYLLLKSLAAEGHGQTLLQKGLERGDTEAIDNARITIDSLLNQEEFWKFNWKCQESIDHNEQILARELNLRSEEFLHIPVLFSDAGDGKAVSFAPNMVNHLVLGHYSLAPKPYGPEIEGCDVFERAFQDAVPDQKVIFLDTRSMFYDNHGGIHCATNVLREPFPDKRWWQYKPYGAFDM